MIHGEYTLPYFLACDYTHFGCVSEGDIVLGTRKATPTKLTV